MLFVAALVAVVSFIVGPTRWLGIIVLFCLAFSVWFLAWPETVGSADVCESLAIFGLLGVWGSVSALASWPTGLAALTLAADAFSELSPAPGDDS